jgi:hypothetical protein
LQNLYQDQLEAIILYGYQAREDAKETVSIQPSAISKTHKKYKSQPVNLSAQSLCNLVKF